MKDSVHTAHGLDDRGILIAGANFASSKDGKVGASRINTDTPARRRSGHLDSFMDVCTVKAMGVGPRWCNPHNCETNSDCTGGAGCSVCWAGVCGK